MPYVAQDGVWCGLRGKIAAEATVNAISRSQCHIGVASEFRVGGGCTKMLRITHIRSIYVTLFQD